MNDDRTETLSEFDRRYLRILDDVLRSHRKRKGWTRKNLLGALRTLTVGAADISLHTLATYELGTRQCGSLRIVQLAMALEVDETVIHAEVRRRLHGDAGGFVIDLRKLAGSDAAELTRVAGWAAVQLAAQDGQPPVRSLTMPALEQLAEICGLDVADMVGALRAYRVAATSLAIDTTLSYYASEPAEQ